MRCRVRTLILMAAALSMLVGCADKRAQNDIPAVEAAALEWGKEFELLSLEPLEPQSEEEGRFHGWKVLGKTTIDGEGRRQLLAALKKGVSENKGVAAACFNPRHGIRVKRNGKIFDFAICFECLSALTYIDGEQGKGFLVSASPQTVFDGVLQRASVPLAKPNSH